MAFRGITAIKGFGFKVSNISFDYHKILNKIDGDWVNNEIENGTFSLEEYNRYCNGAINKVNEIIYSTGKKLFLETLENNESSVVFGDDFDLESTSSASGEVYLYVRAKMIWEIKENHKQLSRLELAEFLVNMVHPFTNFPKFTLLRLLDDIDDYKLRY